MIRVFPRKTKWTPTDELAFIGDPPLFRPEDSSIPILISTTFTWDIPEAKRLKMSWGRFYQHVYLGGPAFDASGEDFTPGRFLKTGVTITSRGCPKKCPWCFVWKREGPIRTLPIVPGNIVQDNNLLACPRKHIEAVFEMLQDQPGIIFSGGLDATLMRDWHRNRIESLSVKELWFAADTPNLSALQRAKKICDGIPIQKMRCYVMIGFNEETLADAERRLKRVYELGFLPFAQLYRSEKPMDYSAEWKVLARKWSRPAAYRKDSKCKIPN